MFVPGSELTPQAVFKPNDVTALLTGVYDVEVAIAVHVHQVNVVRGLVLMDVVGGEVAPAVIFKPRGSEGVLCRGHNVDISVSIDVSRYPANGDRVGSC